MRGFFLLLLLTNVGFLAWQYLGQDGAVQVDPYRGITFDNQGLTLLSELPASKRPSLRSGAKSGDNAQPQAPVSTPAVPGKQESAIKAKVGEDVSGCYTVSNIEDRETLDKLIDGLKRQGAGGVEQSSVQGEETNYWVMLPPYGDRDKAADAAALLKKQQVKDFFIVRSGEYINAVSLGVFSSRERAERRYNQIVALKVRLRKPKIESIHLPAKRYRVSYELRGEGPHKAVTGLLKGLGLENSKEITCK